MNKRWLKILFSVSLASPLIFNAGFNLAAAQSEELKSALQNVAGSIDELKEVKASTTPEADKKDFLARRAALDKVLSLTLVEIKELRSKLEAIKKEDGEGLFKAAGQFLSDLSDHQDQVEVFNDSLNKKNLTTEDIKAIAAKLKDWREKVYDPENRIVLDLFLVYQGGSILKTAESRLEKIQSDIRKLEAALSIDPAHFKSNLDDSARDLWLARDSFNKAQDIFLNIFSAFNASSSSENASTTPISDDLLSFNETQAQALVKNEFEQITSAYKRFFTMSKLAKKLLSQ